MSTRPADLDANRATDSPVLPALLPIEDLSARAASGDFREVVQCSPPALIENAIRALYRKSRRHVLITGPKGVGKTTFLHELARMAGSGEVPFLAGRRFVRIDCQYVSREDSRVCLESILRISFNQPDVVLCLDGLSSLLKRPGGEDNKALLKSCLARPGTQIVATMSRWEFNDLIGNDAELTECFTRIELDEPHGEALSKIVHQIARQLESEFDVQIPAATVQRTLTLCSGYILNECFPDKATKILRRVCEDLDFDRTQRGAKLREISPEKLTEVLSAITGIPETTLQGNADQPEFEVALEAEVFGQSAAVAAVAAELRLIRAGLVDQNKPATVLLFAGMTGVGKTELAKQLAKLYSTSGRLQTYPMGNFTEPHSVSGIIGVPPGYVGHDQGGRLVNDLNSDPYSVFLLDEGEKAHPNIWVPFLNLFDEGWLIDQRGRKAYADRAIFVLTTNAGADSVSQMAAAGHSPEDIEIRVRQMLGKVRHERSSQPVFTSQFLARIKKIVVFRSLDAEAMLQICQKLVMNLERVWQERRGKQIRISSEVIQAIARSGYLTNQKSGGREGGRIIRKLLSDHVESRIQTVAASDNDAYKRAAVIYVNPLWKSPLQASSAGEAPVLEFEILFQAKGTEATHS